MSDTDKKKKKKVIKLPETGDVLLKKKLKPINYIMDDFLSTSGVYLLAGASKMGKTWLTLDLSIAISQGKEFMGKKTQTSKTLYIDLESSETSLKSRLGKMFQREKTDLSNWFYTHQCGRIGESFEAEMYEMQEALKEKGEEIFKLIVVDVFVKIRSDIQKGMTEYKHDYNDLSILKKIANYYDMCFVIITHLRKMKDENDVFNQMTGSTGLMGASDGSILLARKRGEEDATIHTEGRDIMGDTYAMRWNKELKRWQYVGRSEVVRAKSEHEDFLETQTYQAIKEMLSDKTKELRFTVNELFDKLCFEYCQYKSLPPTAAKLGKFIKENVLNFRKSGILVRGKRLNTGMTYSFEVGTPVDEEVPFN